MAYKDLVQQLYVGYYGRPADKEGLDFWNDKLEEADGDFKTIMDEFVDPDEYQVPMDGDEVDYEALVNWFYDNLFGREAEEEGLNWYVERLESGEFTVEDVGKRIMDGAQNGDVDTMANRVDFANYVTDAVEGYDFSDEETDELLALLDGIDADTDLDGVKDTFDDWLADKDPTPVDPDAGNKIMLSLDQDLGWKDFEGAPTFNEYFYGSEGDDVYLAPIMGTPQANSFGFGDYLDGNDGWDLLDAQVTEGANYGGLGMPVQGNTKNIEEVRFEAINANMAEANSDVYVDATDMWGVKEFWSDGSKANLVVQDLTTKDNDGVTKRSLEDIKIGMSHTGSADSDWDASDFKVYFDQNYILPIFDYGEDNVFYRIMNMDAVDQGFDPLLAVNLVQFDFRFNGERYELADYIGDNDPTGEVISTYEELLPVLQEALEALVADNPGLSLEDLRFELGDNFTTRHPDTQQLLTGTEIVLVASGEHTLEAREEWAVIDPAPEPIEIEGVEVRNSARYERADAETGDITQEIRIDIALDKVGRGGDGGELVVGSMAKGDDMNIWSEEFAGKGIPIFDVVVYGDEYRPSNLAGLRSTNNNLREVYIDTDPEQEDSYADLTIGSLKDVRVMDSTGFKGDLDLTANLTGEIVEKYGLSDATNDLATRFEYTLGSGDNTLNLSIDNDVFKFFQGQPGATYQDFILDVTGGSGDDTINVNFDGWELLPHQLFDFIGDQFGGIPGQALWPSPDLVPAWYWNQSQMDNIFIDAGDGDNVVTTFGSGNMNIETGSGNDAIYVDNSGIRDLDIDFWLSADFSEIGIDEDFLADLLGLDMDLPVDFDFGLNIPGLEFDLNTNLSYHNYASAILNGTLSPYHKILGDGNQSYKFFKGSLQVGFKGVNSEWVDINYTDYVTTTRDIHQAIIAAVEGSNELQKLVEVHKAPGDSLLIRSKIDGSYYDAMTFIDVRGPVAQNGGFDDDGGDDANWAPYLNQVSVAELESAWQKYYPGSEGIGEDSDNGEFADPDDALDFLNAMYDNVGDAGDAYNITAIPGLNSTAYTSNVVNAGSGDDVIVLSSNNVAVEEGVDFALWTLLSDTVVFEGNFGNNTIMHFAANPDWVVEEGQVGAGIQHTVGNDILDFTAYLDWDAALRGTSVDPGTDAPDKDFQVDFTFTNEYVDGQGVFEGLHNEIGLLRFSDLIDAYEDIADNDYKTFADFGAGDLEEALNNDWAVGDIGAEENPVGSEYVVLVGKDGDLWKDADGDWAFDETDAQFGEYELNEFKVFTGTIDSDEEFQIVAYHGTVNLGDTDLDLLNDFNFEGVVM